MKLDHVVSAVSDRGRSDAFYRDDVGAEIVEQDGCAFYRLGEQQLNPAHARHQTGRGRPHPGRPGNSDLGVEWPGSIAAAAADVARNGVVVELGPLGRQGARGRGTNVYVRDPDGSLIEFIASAWVRCLPARTFHQREGEHRRNDHFLGLTPEWYDRLDDEGPRHE